MDKTSSVFLRILIGVLLYSIFFGTAQALFVTDPATVSADTTLTFDEIIVPNDPAEVFDANFGLLTDQYASSYGVTFTSGMYQGNSDDWGSTIPNISGYALSSITGSVDPNINPLEIAFSSIQTQVGFNLAGFNLDPGVPNTTFSAYMDGTLVESVMALVNEEAPNFYGFVGINFNRLVIELGTAGVGGLPISNLDNLTFDAVSVDEPPVFAIILIGLIGLGLIRILDIDTKTKRLI
jgi:hypothetical protein